MECVFIAFIQHEYFSIEPAPNPGKTATANRRERIEDLIMSSENRQHEELSKNNEKVKWTDWTVDEAFQKLEADEQGLSSEEADKRLEHYGLNTLQEQKDNPVLKFLSYFWGPIPWMIEVAAVLSIVVQHWTDFGVITALLLFNALVGFFQEHQANSAIDALKKQLALQARAYRDGQWQEVDAKQLVPGDIVKIRMGDIIPADLKLLKGDYLSVDQSALTGESLPVDKEKGDNAYSGSMAKQGEMTGLVSATGKNTYFGQTARLVSGKKGPSHFQKAVLNIGDYLIKLSLFLIVILVLVQLFRGDQFLTLIQFALVLAVASIPVALPAVLSVTMAVGALTLSKMKAIVSRLESVEEMAGMDILCSDKTGTLTQNNLTLDDPILFNETNKDTLFLDAALASTQENQDPIDEAIFEGLGDLSRLKKYRINEFTPFDPVSKRTEAVVQQDETTFYVSKGAPEVILDLCEPDEALEKKANEQIDKLASTGYRTLGVARSEDGEKWQFLGLIPLYDPPREDSSETIERATEHGISIKMITGDDLAIAREIASQLGLGTNIRPSSDFFDEAEQQPTSQEAEEIENQDGFARVFPEHKYQIVKSLQEQNHIVGMTGDGVNDAPALKQADVGIAVSGAADAARNAADLVLTAPGLSVIVKAVEEARRIFERMNSYAIYRITETIRIMLFMVLAMIAFDFYPITAVMIILLALLNDLPIMTISKDNTWLDPKPVRWNMKRVLTVASILGGIGVAETFGLLYLVETLTDIGRAQIQTIIFLKLVVAGHMTLLVARSQKPFFRKPYPSWMLISAILSTQVIAALVAGLGWFMTAIPWSYIGYVWLYCIVWIFIEDWAKLKTYETLSISGKRHSWFLKRLGESFHSHSR